MVLPAHYLWGWDRMSTKGCLTHVTRRSACVLGIIRAPNSSDAEVSDSKIAVDINYDVLRLDVPVDDVLIMAVLEACYDASNEEAYTR